MSEIKTLKKICEELNEAAKDSVVEFRLDEIDPHAIWRRIEIWIKDPLIGEERLFRLSDPLRALLKETFKRNGWTVDGNNTKTTLWLGEKLEETTT